MVPVDKAQEKKVNDVCGLARITLTEIHLMRACVQSEKNIANVGGAINNQIKMWPKVNLTFADVSPAL